MESLREQLAAVNSSLRLACCSPPGATAVRAAPHRGQQHPIVARITLSGLAASRHGQQHPIVARSTLSGLAAPHHGQHHLIMARSIHHIQEHPIALGSTPS